MILDSSAIVAVIEGEPVAGDVLALLAEADRLAAGAPTLVETGIVLIARLGPTGRTLLGRFRDELNIDAFQSFGKGRHKAALNFGDCLTYAIAKCANEPLLCIGADFTETDLHVVTPAG